MRQRHGASQKPPKCGCRKMLRRGKTAEVRFNMLARGWFAYPVTPRRTQLPPKSDCREMLRRGKTAEVRFNTLARGWLAYPVTPWHAQLPPKCGCRNTIATSVSSRSDGTFPTRYAERSGCVPGFCASFSSRVPEVRHYLWRGG